MDNYLNEDLKENEDIRGELVKKLLELQDIVKYHTVDSMGIIYSNSRGVPVLNVSSNGINEEGKQVWLYHFLEDDTCYNFIESINTLNSDLAI